MGTAKKAVENLGKAIQYEYTVKSISAHSSWPDREKLLNHMGENGWQLVGIQGEWIYFMREKQSD